MTVPKTPKKTGRGAVIFLFLFALPFAGGGTFVGYLAVSMVNTWWRAQSWHEVPAAVISADLDVNYGDDSTTYRLDAVYEYEYDGSRYTSDSVSLGFGSDNIGSFHQDKYAEVRRYVGGARPFRCFVNPADPSEALLYREMRWGMLAFQTIFALAFGLVGYGLMFAAVYGGRLVKEGEELKAARPAEPWLWEKDWVDGKVRANSKGRMIGAIIFATLWNLISAPVWIFMPDELASGNRLALIAFIFPAVGLLLGGWAVYAVLQWRKFGDSELEMFTLPGVLGGYLEGRVHTNLRKRPSEGFELTLTCVRKETRGSGDNRSTREVVLWQDAYDVAGNALMAGPRGLSVPVRFAIPYDAGPQSDPEASDPVIWRLEVDAELPGVDYGTQFDVPVFETPDSDRQLRAETHEPAASVRIDPAEKMRTSGIVRQPGPGGGTAWVFQRARAKGAAIGLTLFTAVWCGMIWIMIAFGAPIFFPIVFSLFAVLMVWSMIDLWLKETRVEIANGTLTFTRRLLAAGKTVSFAATEVAAIRTKGGMQSGNKLYYQIVLRTRDGKEHTLAAQIADHRLAKRLSADFEAALAT